MNTEIKPGQRRVVSYGAIRVLECKCDRASLSVPLSSKVHKSFCPLCGITKVT